MMIKPFDEINKQHRKKILKNLESNTITFKENDNILSSFKNSKLIGIIQKGSISIIREDYNGNIIVLDKINQYELFIEELCILSSDDKVIANTDTVISFFDYDLLINNKKLKCHDYYNQFVLNILQIVMEITKNNKIRIEILNKKSIKEKLLEYFRLTYPNSRIIYLQNSITELAIYLGVNRSALSRELGNLKEEGIIDIKNKKITLLYKKNNK